MEREIRVREFGKSDLENVYRLVQNVVDISYKGVYPEEALDIYKEYHSKENILNDAVSGCCMVAENGSEIVGTGTLVEGNVRRVYISPLHQHTGIGKLIMNEIVKKALNDKVPGLDLGASLVSRRFWESLGFEVVKEDFVPIKKTKNCTSTGWLRTFRLIC